MASPTDPFPPPGFIPVASAIEGIEVFKPIPPEEEQGQPVVEFKCPQCGADTAYSIADGGLTCTHCGYYEAPQRNVVGRDAQAFEFTVETMQRAAQGWGEARKELDCQNCGARTSLPADALTHTCPFCGSHHVIQREAAQDVLRPRFLIPFRVQHDDTGQIAREWLQSSWMTPRPLHSLARLAEFTSIYLPYWTFDATSTADWRAEVGHTQSERYYDHSDRTWKTRTKTVWRWESGRVTLEYDDVLVSGTARLSTLLLNQIQDFNLDNLVPYEPAYLAGFHAQAYDVLLEAAWEQGRKVMREGTRLACLRQASTSQVRNFNMTLDFSDENWRYLLLPFYIAVYTYGGETYQVMINGHSGAIAGQRPVDWTRVWLVIAALLAPGLLLSSAGLITLAFGGIGLAIGGIGLVLLAVSLVIAAIIFRRAQSMDDI